MQVLFPLRNKVEMNLPSNLRRVAALMRHANKDRQCVAPDEEQLCRRWDFNAIHHVVSRSRNMLRICRCPLLPCPSHYLLLFVRE